jgi:molybdopterin converting factor subunit 1
MRINIKLFAILREKAGTAEIPLELETGATVAAAVATLLQRRPDLAAWLPRAACAVNLARANATLVLHEGDELALLPPVSGGT